MVPAAIADAVGIDEETGDLIFFALLAVGFIATVEYLRNRQAAGDYAGYFTPTAPASDPVSSLIDVLVPMKLSQAGEDFLKQQEGFTAAAKPDGARQVIGWGHDIMPGENIKSPISKAQAQGLFNADKTALESGLNSVITVPVSQGQFDALFSLAYNIGIGAFERSSLLQSLNAGDYASAAADFQAFNMAGGRYNQSLADRRQREFSLFLS